MGCLQEIARLSARWTRLLQDRKSTTLSLLQGRSKSKRAAGQRFSAAFVALLGFLRLIREVVDVAGCPVPFSAESRRSSQASCPQKVSDDSSRRRVLLSPAPQPGGQIFAQGRASVFFEGSCATMDCLDGCPWPLAQRLWLSHVEYCWACWRVKC